MHCLFLEFPEWHAWKHTINTDHTSVVGYSLSLSAANSTGRNSTLPSSSYTDNTDDSTSLTSSSVWSWVLSDLLCLSWSTWVDLAVLCLSWSSLVDLVFSKDVSLTILSGVMRNDSGCKTKQILFNIEVMVDWIYNFRSTSIGSCASKFRQALCVGWNWLNAT